MPSAEGMPGWCLTGKSTRRRLGLRRDERAVALAVARRRGLGRPPDPVSDSEQSSGDEHCADEQGVEQQADRDRRSDHGELDRRELGGGEGGGQHDACRGDHAVAGPSQRGPSSRARPAGLGTVAPSYQARAVPAGPGCVVWSGSMADPSGSSAPVSSKATTPLHSRLQPCSGWQARTRAAWRQRACGGGHAGTCGQSRGPPLSAVIRAPG